MDTGKGYFEQVEGEHKENLERLMRDLEAKHPSHGGWFREGETIEIRGSLFRVKRIKPNEIVLKLETRAIAKEL